MGSQNSGACKAEQGGPGFGVQFDCVALRAVAPFQFALVCWGLVQGLDLKQRLPAFLCDIFVFFLRFYI